MRARFHLLIIVTLCYLALSLSIVDAAALTQYNLSYDPVGNMRQGFDQVMEYNSFNQLESVKTNNGTLLEEYVYDHGGQRILKAEPTTNKTTYYWSDEY